MLASHIDLTPTVCSHRCIIKQPTHSHTHVHMLLLRQSTHLPRSSAQQLHARARTTHGRTVSLTHRKAFCQWRWRWCCSTIWLCLNKPWRRRSTTLSHMQIHMLTHPHICLHMQVCSTNKIFQLVKWWLSRVSCVDPPSLNLSPSSECGT